MALAFCRGDRGVESNNFAGAKFLNVTTWFCGFNFLNNCHLFFKLFNHDLTSLAANIFFWFRQSSFFLRNPTFSSSSEADAPSWHKPICSLNCRISQVLYQFIFVYLKWILVEIPQSNDNIQYDFGVFGSHTRNLK